MAHGKSLIMRAIQPRVGEVVVDKPRSFRSSIRSKTRPLNACKVPLTVRRAERRAKNKQASASRRVNR